MRGLCVYFFTRASKNVHTVLTLAAVLIWTWERHKSYTFWNENAEKAKKIAVKQLESKDAGKIHSRK